MKKIVHFLFSITLLFFSAQLYAGIIYATQNGAGAKDGSSWENALDATQLKTAIDNAAPGTDFWVAAGTYYPGNAGDNYLSFNLKNDVGLYGGFNGTETSFSQRNPSANVTILSGDLDKTGTRSDDDAFHVVQGPYTSNTAIIDGFTITMGNARIYEVTDERLGGGLEADGSSAVIRKCRFVKNYSYYGGGAISGNGYGGHLSILNCYFDNNSSQNYAEAIWLGQQNALIENCVFANHSNSWDLLTMVGGTHSITITNCTFANNHVGYLFSFYGSTQITNCIFWNNSFWWSFAATDANINYSDVQGGWTGSGSNNINANPSFANSQFELLACSPAINAGTNTNAPANDYLGNTRPYNGGIADMGAYEFQGEPSVTPVPVISYDNLVLTCSGGSVTGVRLTSDAGSGNQWFKDGVAVSGATAQTYNPVEAGSYTVQVTSGGCISDMSDSVAVTSSFIPPGDPAVFGDNVWNVYAWNAGDALINEDSWNTNYVGYYVDSSFSFDTRNKWNESLSPSSAPGFQGCAVQADNHSWSAKRKGFLCGRYTINIPWHDDAAQLFIDSVKVWEHNGCCDIHNNIWTGDLGPNSLVEFRVTEGGGSSNGSITINYVSANPAVPVIVAGQTISCSGTPISLVSSSLTGNQWYLNDVAIPGAIAQEYSAGVTGNYTVQVTSPTGCNATSAVKSIIIGIPGDTAQFGNNVWNVYAFNAGSGTLASGPWTSDYTGYYVDTALQFNTRAKWNENTSPSNAPGFLGCGTVNNDYHSWWAKRKGFPCGHYTISIPAHDDAAQLFVNGVKVWEHDGCCDIHNNVWEGDLNYASTVEFRGTDGGGPSNGTLSFVLGSYTIAGVKFICGPTGQTTLDAGIHETYAWSTGETTQTIIVNNAGPYAVTVSDSTCLQTANTTIAVGSPLDSLSISAVSSSSCPGSKLMLEANAYVNNDKIITTRTYYIDVNHLVNLPYACPPVQYGNSGYYSSAWGFNWIDSAGNGKIIKVQVQFALGIEGNYNGATHGTKLNGANGQFINTPYWQWCNTNPNFNPVISLNVDTSKYIKNGQNTFLIADDNLNGGGFNFGLRTWAELNGYYAKITVTYESDLLFAWTPGNLANQQIAVYPTETTDYTLTANYQGCVSTASYHAVVNPVPTITADGSAIICPGSSVTLTASEGASYVWSNGETTRSITATAAGEYFVTVDNCRSSSGVTVSYIQGPTITASGPTTFCPGFGIDLTATEGLNYAWSTGAISQTIHVTDSGNYTIQVTDTNGCTQTASQQIIVQPLAKPELIANSSTQICENNSGYSDFYVSNADYLNTYSVSSDSVKNYGYGYFLTAYPGMYTVTAEDPLGCVSEPSDPIAITGTPGNPDDFGDNAWNVYAFDNGATYWGYNVPWTQYLPDINGYGIGDINAYYGYYTDSTLSFNTQNKWQPDAVPSEAPGFQGCGLDYSYGYFFSWSAKRKGFPCGHYQINVLNHDDEAELWVNGVMVWSEGGATGTPTNNVWEGVLGPNSTVVFRVNNSGYGASYGAIDLVLTDTNTVAKPTISPVGPITVCEGSATTLTSSAATGNLWSTGATTQSINVTATGNYFVTVSNEEGCTAQSDAVSVTVLPVVTWYRDADGDGYGNPSVTTQDCTQPSGYVADNTDCNDTKANIFPKPWYRDFDGDGYGNLSNTTIACTKPAGYVANKGDCNDSSAAVHHGATEICDGIDNDCDGIIDEGFAKVNYYRDADTDGYGDPAQLLRSCSVPAGYVTNKADCNDGNAAIHPGAADICDGLDNDCDGLFDEDCVSIAMNDTAATEGLRNQKAIRFTVTLSKKSTQTVTVNYTTQDGTATAGSDYIAQSGSISFLPGVRKQLVTIAMLGDNMPESDEDFSIVLSNPVNAIIADGIGTGTILNDDGTAIAGGEGIALKVEEQAKTSVSLSPNPANNKVYVSLKGYSGNITINITSLEGKPLLQRKVQLGAAKLPQESIDVSRLAMGIYMVMIVDESGNIKTERLVIQR